MKLKNILLVATLSTFSLIITSCASRCVTINQKPTVTTERLGSGVYGDAKVESPVISQNNDGFLQATSKIINTTSDTQNFQYRFEWFDKNGNPTGEPSSWKPIELYPNLVKTISSSAPNKNTRSANIQICTLEY